MKWISAEATEMHIPLEYLISMSVAKGISLPLIRTGMNPFIMGFFFLCTFLSQ